MFHVKVTVTAVWESDVRKLQLVKGNVDQNEGEYMGTICWQG